MNWAAEDSANSQYVACRGGKVGGMADVTTETEDHFHGD